MANQVDINLKTKVTGGGDVKKLLAQLEELKAKSNIPLTIGGESAKNPFEGFEKIRDRVYAKAAKKRKDDVANQDSMEKIKLDIVKNNLQKKYQAELDDLRKKKDLTSREVKDFKKKVDETIAIRQGARAEFTEDISSLMALREYGNYMKAQGS